MGIFIILSRKTARDRLKYFIFLWTVFHKLYNSVGLTLIENVWKVHMSGPLLMELASNSPKTHSGLGLSNCSSFGQHMRSRILATLGSFSCALLNTRLRLSSLYLKWKKLKKLRHTKWTKLLYWNLSSWNLLKEEQIKCCDVLNQKSLDRQGREENNQVSPKVSQHSYRRTHCFKG